MKSARRHALTAAQRKIAATWRSTPNVRDAWLRLLAYARRARSDDGNLGYWGPGWRQYELLFGSDASRLVLFEKHAAMEAFAFPVRSGRTRERAESLRIAVALSPNAPLPFDIENVRKLALVVGGTTAFVGDLTPFALHTLGTLRTGKVDSPSLSRGNFDVRWAGISDPWLAYANKTGRSSEERWVAMGWLEREYWGVVKRFFPNVQHVIGDNCFNLLENGIKLTSESFSDVIVRALVNALERA